eukprot:768272-Hanusia_phi.AAC.4
MATTKMNDGDGGNRMVEGGEMDDMNIDVCPRVCHQEDEIFTEAVEDKTNAIEHHTASASNIGNEDSKACLEIQLSALVEINKKKIADCAFKEEVNDCKNCCSQQQPSSNFIEIKKFMDRVLETLEPSLEALVCGHVNSLNAEKHVNEDQLEYLKRYAQEMNFKLQKERHCARENLKFLEAAQDEITRQSSEILSCQRDLTLLRSQIARMAQEFDLILEKNEQMHGLKKSMMKHEKQMRAVVRSYIMIYIVFTLSDTDCRLKEEKMKLSSEIEAKTRKIYDLSQRIEVYAKDNDGNIANIAILLEEKENLLNILRDIEAVSTADASGILPKSEIAPEHDLMQDSKYPSIEITQQKQLSEQTEIELSGIQECTSIDANGTDSINEDHNAQINGKGEKSPDIHLQVEKNKVDPSEISGSDTDSSRSSTNDNQPSGCMCRTETNSSCAETVEQVTNIGLISAKGEVQPSNSNQSQNLNILPLDRDTSPSPRELFTSNVQSTVSSDVSVAETYNLQDSTHVVIEKSEFEDKITLFQDIDQDNSPDFQKQDVTTSASADQSPKSLAKIQNSPDTVRKRKSDDLEESSLAGTIFQSIRFPSFCLTPTRTDVTASCAEKQDRPVCKIVRLECSEDQKPPPAHDPLSDNEWRLNQESVMDIQSLQQSEVWMVLLIAESERILHDGTEQQQET